MDDDQIARPGPWQRFLALVEASSASRYTQANFVYLFYTSIIMYVNLNLAPRATDAYTDDVYYMYECVA